MTDRIDLKKSSLHVLVLAVLAREPLHGYAIAREIGRRSKNALGAGEGILYPALQLLEQQGLIVGAWDVQRAGPARKVYRITDTGRIELEKRAVEWRTYVKAVDDVIGGLPHGQPA